MRRRLIGGLVTITIAGIGMLATPAAHADPAGCTATNPGLGATNTTCEYTFPAAGGGYFAVGSWEVRSGSCANPGGVLASSGNGDGPVNLAAFAGGTTVCAVALDAGSAVGVGNT